MEQTTITVSGTVVLLIVGMICFTVIVVSLLNTGQDQICDDNYIDSDELDIDILWVELNVTENKTVIGYLCYVEEDRDVYSK